MTDLFPQLDETGRARKTDPFTSQEAGRSIEANPVEQIVLDAIRASPAGLTADEIVARTGLAKNTATPRTAPLTRKRLIYTDGSTKMGAAGRRLLIWKAVTT